MTHAESRGFDVIYPPQARKWTSGQTGDDAELDEIGARYASYLEVATNLESGMPRTVTLALTLALALALTLTRSRPTSTRTCR